MTVPDENGRPIPDPGLGVVRAAGPSGRELAVVGVVVLITLAALIGIAIVASGGKG